MKKTEYRRQHTGFSLVELLVAMGLFVLMGVLLLTFAQSALSLWRQAEARRQIYTRGNAVMEIVNEDLMATFPLEPAGTVEIMAFLRCDRPSDLADNSPLLHFVRTVEAGPERYYMAYAGVGGPNGEHFNLQDDDGDGIIDNNLRTLGGLMEVVYYKEGEQLMRAVMAPPIKDIDIKANRDQYARPVASQVLFFDVRFWDRWTDEWEAENPYDWQPVRKMRGYALPIWDSSRSGTDPLFEDRGYYDPNNPGTKFDPVDDVFPEKIRITIVVDANRKVRRMTRLQAAADDVDGLLRVDTMTGIPDPDDRHPYIYIEGEWMRVVEKVSSTKLRVKRGQRGTTALDHKARAQVRAGHTFIREIFLPHFRRDYLQQPRQRR